jgi:hypothetical protein
VVYREKDEMTVNEYTVSDTDGKISGDNEGKILVSPEDPYRFYVRNPVFSTDDPPDGTPAFLIVQIIMPLGGKESGLFRFPRVGEKVLVGTETASGTNFHYLMGYIPTYKPADEETNTPSSQDFRTAGMFQDDGRGEVFRYRQTGKRKAPPGEKYSEIGFYHKQTAWRAAEKEQANYADNQDATGAYVYPKIDRINIHSTGDIHESAINHHRVQAKRFELLVNAAEKNNLPLGDNPGDDSELHAGDIHIRAGNRVVLKAGEGIILQVGKTVLEISDNGLNITSKMINSNVSNPYDATVSINKEGISLFGFNVKIDSIKSFAIGDAFSGEFSSDLGIVSIGGREIKADSYDSAQFKAVVINALQQHALSIKAGYEGVGGLSYLIGKEPDDEKDKDVEEADSPMPYTESDTETDDTGIAITSANTNIVAPPAKSDGGRGASVMEIGLFVLDYGKEIVDLLRKFSNFIKKVIGLGREYVDVTVKLEREKVENATKNREAAVKKAEEDRAAAVAKAGEDKAAEVEKAGEDKAAEVDKAGKVKDEKLNKAAEERETAERQAEMDKALGKITPEEADERIKAAQEKEKTAIADAEYWEKRSVADAEQRETQTIAAANKKEADTVKAAKLKEADTVGEAMMKEQKILSNWEKETAEKKEKAAKENINNEAKAAQDKADKDKEAKIKEAEDILIEKDKQGMTPEERKQAVAEYEQAKKNAEDEAGRAKTSAAMTASKSKTEEEAKTNVAKKKADEKVKANEQEAVNKRAETRSQAIKENQETKNRATQDEQNAKNKAMEDKKNSGGPNPGTGR